MGKNLSRHEKRVKVLVPQECPTLCSLMDCNSPGSSVYEIFQARILELVAISFSRAFSQPRDQTQVPYSAGGSITVWATREAQDKLFGEKMKNILSKIRRKNIIFLAWYLAPLTNVCFFCSFGSSSEACIWDLVLESICFVLSGSQVPSWKGRGFVLLFLNNL